MKSISWSKFRSKLLVDRNLSLIDIEQFSRDIGADSPSDWRTLAGWEQKKDDELLALFKAVPDDDLIVIGEACHTRRHAPLLVSKSNSMKDFMADYFSRFGESLFNGDVFIFCFSANYVGIFHHEGRYFEGELVRNNK